MSGERAFAFADTLAPGAEREFVYGLSAATARTPSVPFLFRVTQQSSEWWRESAAGLRKEQRKKARAASSSC